MPAFSVTVCTRDMGNSLPRAVDSVLRQSDPDWELLICDNASQDDTPVFLQSLRDRRIRVFRNEENRGVVWSRNFLIAQAHGVFLSVLDADDAFTEHKLRDHRSVLERDNEVSVVWGASEMEGEFTVRYPEVNYRFGWDLVTPYRAVHSAMTFRKSAVVAVGGYDPETAPAEAPDLFLRLGDSGKQRYLDTVVCHKTIHHGGEFRRIFATQGDAISKKLLDRTLQRRYGKTR